MKKFENPEMEVVEFNTMDIITTSGCETELDGDCIRDIG